MSSPAEATAFARVPSELVPIADLRPHPDNYREHPADQLAHIKASILAEGVYRNVVVAADGTILAGHGVVEALRELGATAVEVKRLPVDPMSPRALKVVAGDNEAGRLGVVDDRKLSEILKAVMQAPADDGGGLLGTGFDEMMLANLVYVTRHEDEIEDFNAAKEWVGLPAYEEKDETKDVELQLVITFDNERDREEFVAMHALRIASRRGGRKWSTTWPFKEKHDRQSVRFKENDDVAPAVVEAAAP